ncbi:MAG TPA: IclR family transcriptional regulator [Pseudolabrys sp.]|jgi:IclR family acetate operon transcriptional repressor|nr:IclR family transcriptional regulator [Pseudolabrys sp.]
MDATILPGPGAEARALNGRANGDRHSIQSVDRALFLLETIAEAGGETTLTDLATRTGLNISTCHHLLATLIKRGFAAKVPGRRLYALGARILYLGHACLQVDLPRRAQPYMEAVNQATGETVHLAALQGDSVVTLAVREARHAVRVDTGKIGKVEAPHATSVGKAILAWLPEDEMRRIVAGGMKRYTDKTITEFPELLESLRIVRRNGYAIDREEYLPGVICVGAAIRDQAGAVIGAISASTPAMRASDEHIALMRNEIHAATRALSAEFGEPASQTNQAVAF